MNLIDHRKLLETRSRNSLKAGFTKREIAIHNIGYISALLNDGGMFFGTYEKLKEDFVYKYWDKKQGVLE